MPLIAVRGPKGPTVIYQFDQDTISVGRSGANDLVLLDPLLSRVHAGIRREASGWVVEDHESRNGVLLNGRPIRGPARLAPADEIGLGRTVLVFDAPESGGPPGTDAESRNATWSGRGDGSGVEERVLVSDDPVLCATRSEIHRVALSPLTVLITGETGTGKELVARLIHERSLRTGPFVVVNCPALPASLIESELFGVEKGVATDVEGRPGQLESARKGTLFLDEVGDLEQAAQAKLLRFLQDRVARRIGGREETVLDVRVVAATNHDLEADVAAGSFRRDLFHRLNGIRIALPPLRQRPSDIPVLVDHFLSRPGGPSVRISSEATALLQRHHYPGNVRELEHFVERARWLASGPVLTVNDFPELLRLVADAEQTKSTPGRKDLYETLVSGSGSFWDLVQGPYLRRELSREEVRELVLRGHRASGGSYREMARLFRMEPDYKRLLDFLNRHGLGVRSG